jgi:hypothetical protein
MKCIVVNGLHYIPPDRETHVTGAADRLAACLDQQWPVTDNRSDRDHST